MQSGIFSDIDSDDVYVVFGGKIAMQASIPHKSKFIMLQMQQLDKEYEIGDKHNENGTIPNKLFHLCLTIQNQ